ncbi:MAG: hypothetical protein ACYC05_03965 [Sulfuricella sp.]
MKARAHRHNRAAEPSPDYGADGAIQRKMADENTKHTPGIHPLSALWEKRNIQTNLNCSLLLIIIFLAKNKQFPYLLILMAGLQYREYH